MRFSIIIPMYNVELYIEKCLYSCLKQDVSYSDYEIIVVNDGSLDGSLQIAERIASQAPNIHIISQENSGLSSARNTGLKYAKGEYVWFVDSDDCIRNNCLRNIYNQCKHNGLDILAISAANIINGKEVRRFGYYFDGVISGNDVLVKGTLQHCVPFTIYRRTFLLDNDLKFYLGIFHEDSEFTPRAYYYAQKVGFTNEILYLVTINPNSITRTTNYKKSFDYLKVAQSIHEFQKNVPNKKYFHYHISLMINNAMINLLNAAENNTLSKEENIRLFSRKLYKNRYLFKHLCKSSVLKYKIEGFLFTLFPHSCMKIYRFLVYAFK